VIFEAAAGFSRRDWRFVQSLVAPETRACAYTRAGTEGHGLGELGSDPPAPEDVIAEFDGVYVATAQSTVDDLSALLAAAQIEPPYVLVGHSLGGIYIRLFADRHPDLVAGLVFVDSSHPTQIERFEEILPAPARQSTIEDKISDAFASVVRSAADTGPFGDLPVAILSADPKEGIAEQIRSGVSEDTARAMAALWTELQTDLLNLSTNATREVAENAQHFVHSADPQLVTDTIIDVVRQARGRAATAGGR
jgi:pimeloyl-ACP methyl ester carboxylesterase